MRLPGKMLLPWTARMCVRVALLLVVATGTACTDGAAPTAPVDSGLVRLSLLPRFSAGDGGSAAFNRLRLMITDSATGVVLADTMVAVSDGDAQWNVGLEVRLPEREGPIASIMLIELLNQTAAGLVVEYSSVVPLRLQPGSTAQPQVVLNRGPPANRAITAINIPAPESTLLEGDTLRVRADLTGATGSPRIFWSVLHGDIAAIDTAGVLRAHVPGRTQLVASVGHLADTLDIEVRQRPIRVVMTPDSVVLDRAGGVAAFSARVLDARGADVADAVLVWSSADAAVAAALGHGRFSIAGHGRTTVHATVSGASHLRASAPVVVRPRAVRGVLDATSLSFSSLGASASVGATFFDAADVPVANPSVAWFSSSRGVAEVDGDGNITAIGNGSAVITAVVDGVELNAGVTVRQAAARVTLTPSALALRARGTATLAATVHDARDNAIADASVTWSSSAADVAAVNSAGEVTTSRAGEAVITARSGDVHASAAITVEAGAPADIQLLAGDAQNGRVATTLPGALVIRVTDASGNAVPAADVRWSTAHGSVAGDAQTDSDGRARAAWTLTTIAGAGRATASVGALEVVFGAAAEPGPAARITVTPMRASLHALGETSQLGAAVQDEHGNAAADAVTWLSLDPDVASVDAAGLVSAVSSGTARIRASAGAASAHAEVSVQQRVVTLSVAPAEVTVRAGESAALAVTARDARNAVVTAAAVSWSSSDEAVAHVDASGVVTARTPGSARITASSDAVHAAAVITVRAGHPAALSIVSGGGQSGAVAAALPDPLVVRVVDALGNAVPDAEVVWSATHGALAAEGRTDASGRAAAVWTLGTTPGEQQVTVSAAGGAAAFTATARPGPAAAIEIVSGNGESAVAGRAVSDSLRIRILDAQGNVVPGIAVTWAAASGAAAGDAHTGADGIARAQWTLSTRAGAQQLTVTAGALEAGFSATALPGDAAVVIITPDTVVLNALGQTHPLSAVVHDAFGNVTTDVVTWTSLAEAVAAVDAAGLVTATGSGSARVRATAGTASAEVPITVQQVATSLILSPTQLTLTAGESATLTATARDGGGSSVAGGTLSWSSSAAAVASIEAGGVVTARLAGTAAITVRDGALEATADVTVEAGAPAVLTLVAGDSQTAAVATALPSPLHIRVTDGHDNAVPGAVVTWVPADSGAAVVGDTRTGDDGVAQAQWTLGVRQGEQRLTARVGELTVVFTADANAGPAALVVVTPTSVTLHAIDETQQLNAVVRDAHGNVITDAVTWEALDSAVVVSGYGLVTAVSNGSARVRATAGDVQTEVAIVVEQAVHSVALSAHELALAAGTSETLAGAAYDARGSVIANAELTWSSSHDAVARVDQHGVVTGYRAGSAVIRLSAGSASDSAVVTVSAGAPAALSILTGDNLSAEVGTPLPDSLRILVTDSLGNPVAGAGVTWTTGGSTIEGDAHTGSDGVARALWTLGTRAGAQQATATVGDMAPVEFSASARAGAAVAVFVSADSVTFDALGDTRQLSAQTQDAYGNGTSDAVSWTALDDDVATVSSAGVVTAVGNGTTRIRIVAGSDTTVVQVRVAQVVAEVELSANSAALAAGGEVTLTALPRDARGNAVSDAAVAWSSSDTVRAVVSAGVVTGRRTGTARITASSAGVQASATINVRPGSPASFVRHDGFGHQRAEVARSVPGAVAVLVRDAYGNAVPGARVSWGGHGNVRGDTITDASGIARAEWALDTVAGANKQAFATLGNMSVAFTATADPGPPNRVQYLASALNDTVKAKLTNALEVLVRDRYNNVVPGAAVTWEARHGAPADAQTQTDSTGRARASWNLGSVTGQQHLLARVGELAADSFTAVASPGRPKRIIPSVTRISFDALEDEMPITAAVRDAYDNLIAGATVSWSVSSNAVIRIDRGKVISKGNGSEKLVATFQTATPDTVHVEVAQVADTVTATSATVQIALGATLQLSPNMLDRKGQQVNPAAVQWSSSNTAVAQVVGGRVTGVAVGGPVKITATSGNKKSETLITVVAGTDGGLTIAPPLQPEPR